MITSIWFVNFKNFADETIRVGPFTVIVGENASGKSNVRDAFRFLHGIGRGYTLPEILGGKYGAGGHIEWEAVRGAPNEVARLGQDAFGLHIEMHIDNRSIRYSITVSADKTNPGTFRVTREEIEDSETVIYTSHPSGRDPVRDQGDDTHLLVRMARTGKQKKYGYRVPVRPNQPALTQLREHRYVVRAHKDLAGQVIQVLANMRFLDLVPDQIRMPAFPGQETLEDSGRNLPVVLRKICEDPTRQNVLANWIRELTPMDVQKFEFLIDPGTGRVGLVFREANGRRVSAYSASDGTLRFLTMLAALLGPNRAGLYFFEEIDNGIYPNRQRLLLELIEKQTAKNGIQVVTTTHSPDLLNYVNAKTFENTSVVCRLEDSDDAIIRPVDSLPNARELRLTQGLGRLHTGGWLEDALALTVGYDEDAEGGG